MCKWAGNRVASRVLRRDPAAASVILSSRDCRPPPHVFQTARSGSPGAQPPPSITASPSARTRGPPPPGAGPRPGWSPKLAFPSRLAGEEPMVREGDEQRRRFPGHEPSRPRFFPARFFDFIKHFLPLPAPLVERHAHAGPEVRLVGRKSWPWLLKGIPASRSWSGGRAWLLAAQRPPRGWKKVAFTVMETTATSLKNNGGGLASRKPACWSDTRLGAS